MIFLSIAFLSMFPLYNQISFFCDGGHAAVNRSIQNGCSRLDIDYNWNPDPASTYSTAVVLAGQQMIHHALTLKSQGIIKKLLVGPNVFVRANEGNSIMGHPLIDRCLVPSDWVRVAYEQDNPALKGRIALWPAGINEHEWEPRRLDNKIFDRTVLVYWKTEDESFIKQIINILKKYNWVPHVIQYGNYQAATYKEALEHSSFAVFVSISESQGLALAEAWAMNVPTFVWDAEYLAAHGRVYTYVSSCPYITDSTGKRWKTVGEFEHIIQTIHEPLLKHYTPRAWIINYMTDTASITTLLNIIKNIN